MKIADIEVPEIGFFDILGCATRNGRQKLARKIVSPFAKVDSISAIVTEGFTAALTAGTSKLSEQRCNDIIAGCHAVKTCCDVLAITIDPSGDGGKTVTPDEKALMLTTVEEGMHNLLAQDSVDKVVDGLIGKIP